MQLAFFGSPAFAVPALRALHADGHEATLVVTQPDRRRGRGRRLAPTAVARAARELELPVFQPTDANAPETVGRVRRSGAQVGIVVAYGQILSPELLGAAPQGFYNAHASLLPDYRGAAPVNWAIMRGEERTGVSVIRMVPGLDRGPVVAERATDIGPDETAGELGERLAGLAAELVADVARRIDRGEELPERDQPARCDFFARKLTKEDGRIDWAQPARAVRDHVRGTTPWPGAFGELLHYGEPLRVVVLDADVLAERQNGDAAPGTVVRADEAEGIVVQTGDGCLRISRVKPAGSRAMSAADFLHGGRVSAGDQFS